MSIQTVVRLNAGRGSGWLFDLDGCLRLATGMAPDGAQEVLRIDNDGVLTHLYW